jgi:4-diphosphocytidyl-2-C-methyl-D-erythritol kinase
MALYDVPAPAKINLFLHVVGRRADGYHLLQTAFRFIGLYDTLNFDIRHDGKLELDAPSLAGLAPQDDLVLKAARLLQQATGVKYGAQISCAKGIPSGAGLGGGSSDAASTLIALNRLWQTGLDRQALMQMGLRLGADVPVFIFGQAAFAEGVGEILSPLQLPERAYLVVQPPQKVATAEVFSAPDLTRDSTSVRMSVFTDWQNINAPNHGKFAAGYFGRNDLEPVVFARHANIAAAAKRLAAQGLTARMTGSGACLFVEFLTMQEALVCQKQIFGKMPNSDCDAVVEKTWVCPGLAHHPLKSWIRS